MSDWFTVEKIDDKTYAISEYAHPQQEHEYLIIGDDSAALIDTGLGVANIKEITDRLTDLPVKVVTSHAHFDHIGGHKYYKEIYIHQEEADWLRYGAPMTIEEIREYMTEDTEDVPFPAGFDVNEYYPFKGEPYGTLTDHDIIDLGGRKLKIIHTPGHSPGHICVFDENTGYLFSSDLVYNAELYACFPYSDPVLYSRSIEKIANMKEVKRLFPNHCDLNISLDFLKDVLKEFKELEKQGVLSLGSGTFKYDNFEIVL